SSARHRDARDAGANRGARPVPTDRDPARLPAGLSRRGLSSTRPCPYLLRQATGPARRHGGEQLTDPRQRSGRVLTETFVGVPMAMARATATPDYALEYYHDHRALSKPGDWQRGRGQDPHLDPGEPGPEDRRRRTVDGRRLLPERGLPAQQECH